MNKILKYGYGATVGGLLFVGVFMGTREEPQAPNCANRSEAAAAAESYYWDTYGRVEIGTRMVRDNEGDGLVYVTLIAANGLPYPYSVSPNCTVRIV